MSFRHMLLLVIKFLLLLVFVKVFILRVSADDVQVVVVWVLVHLAVTDKQTDR